MKEANLSRNNQDLLDLDRSSPEMKVHKGSNKPPHHVTSPTAFRRIATTSPMVKTPSG